MNILVTGGAGYIGSHMVKLLLDSDHSVLVLDNLSAGQRDTVPRDILVEGDVGDRLVLDQLFATHKFDKVIHFAAYIEAGESVEQPARYYRNNVLKTLTLLEAMHDHRVRNFIFSSSAAVYGEPHYVPIDEDHPCNPLNPYGRSKLMVEQILGDMSQAFGLNIVSLRYFNAAGIDPGGWDGKWPNRVTHLIPLVLRAASGDIPSIEIFGEDYDTPDGTCIRDYVHVMDLCEAHMKALDYLSGGGKSDVFNLGNGNGFSVREVIEAARSVTERPIKVIHGRRRAGDPARVVADSAKARGVLGWQPRYPRLEQIMAHAWQFGISKSRRSCKEGGR
jgi:UDP-glucose 4-epimerase